MASASSKKQLIQWTRTTVPQILPEAEHGICSELQANYTASAMVASCATPAALMGENGLVC